MYHLIVNNKDYLSKWLIWATNINCIEDEKMAIDRMVKKWQDGTNFVFAIKIENECIGMISIIRIYEESKSCEIGYWIEKEWQGKGIATEALLGLEDEVKKNGFKRIFIRCDERNEKSINLAKRNKYATIERPDFITDGDEKDIFFAKTL